MRSIASTSQSLPPPPRRRQSARRVAPAVLLSLALGVAAPASGAEPGAADPPWSDLEQHRRRDLIQAPPNGAGKTAPEAFLLLRLRSGGGLQRRRWDHRRVRAVSLERSGAKGRLARSGGGGGRSSRAQHVLRRQPGRSRRTSTPSWRPLGNVPEGVAKDQASAMASGRPIGSSSPDEDGRGARSPFRRPPIRETGADATGERTLPRPVVRGSTPCSSIPRASSIPARRRRSARTRTGRSSRRFATWRRRQRHAHDDQTLTARYFADIGIRPLQTSLRDLTIRRGLDISDTARLLAGWT
jgi:hypothetical protein